jgi:hypothetical protein
MPNEKPAWEMTAQEFADNPPSREWFNWFGWPEGHHYCNYSRRYALQTGYPCCIKKAIRDGHIPNTPIGVFVNSPEVVYTCDDCSYNMSCRATAQEVEQCHADQNAEIAERLQSERK